MILNCCKRDILKFYLLVICACILKLPVNAQTKTIDSLKKVLLNAKDTQQVNILNKIAELYFLQTQNAYDSNLIRSKEFADKALQSSKHLHYTKGTGIALFNAGKIAGYTSGNYNHSVALLKEAITFLRKADDVKTLGYCLRIAAETIHELGDNQQAILYYDSAFTIFQKIKDTSGLIQCLEWKGHSYFDMGDYRNAYQYGQLAYELAQKTKDTLAQMLTADYLANIFLGASMPETVLEYMRIITRFYPKIYIQKTVSSWEQYWGLIKTGEAYLQLREVDSAMLVAQVTNFYPGDPDLDTFLGNLFIAKNEYNKALTYFKDGFEISSKSDHPISVARNANGLSRVYFVEKKFDSALYYGNKAAQAASSIHALLEWKNAVSTLTDIYDKTRNYTKAYHFSQLYKSISDSLAPEEYKRKLALIEIQHELENQKQHAQLLAKENQLQTQQNTFEKDRTKRIQLIAIIIISAATLIMAMIFINIRLKRKRDALQKKQLQQELEMQTADSKRAEADFKVRSFELEAQALRAQMNPHFIFNCLNSINRFIINNDAEKAADYLTKFAKLIRIVLEQSGKSFVPLEDELKCLQLYMDLEALRFEIPFKYEINCNGTDTSAVMIPTLLIQPFVENSIWHGLQGKKDDGKIIIDLQLNDNLLLCKICDNGVGISKANIENGKTNGKKSLGIKLTQNRLQLINSSKQKEAEVIVEDLKDNEGANQGTCVHIKIPVAYI